ncbi:Acetylglutamate kinase [Planctomycetes bacterium Poly30]|uniref:Acetylglutamate kinase n=1 Tax=Saltatorellus ferox TaxID=2528018 RepID=A0A518EYQ6_9BACT|nr:Acetylglutamate kinase [Planctomycetes bacterium Poly30]
MSAEKRRRVVLKIGGSVLDDPATRVRFAANVAQGMTELDLDVVIIHGGGAQLTRHQERLGLEVKRNDRGLRITDPETALAAVQVLGGEVNAALVSALAKASVRSIGLTCADANLASARVLDPALGAVGEIVAVDASVLEDLAAARFVPVIATVAPDEADALGTSFLNVNADAAVAPIAGAWGADAVLFLSDVASVLDGDQPVLTLDAAGAARLEARGVLKGGMIPKVEAALSAAAALPGTLVKIASGNATQALVAALGSGAGTSFIAPNPIVTASEVAHGS